MLSLPAWVQNLKASGLHKVAVKIGTPCSGTKATQLAGIRDALESLPTAESNSAFRPPIHKSQISLVSIDMGIRNLAYSHWTANIASSPKRTLRQYDLPVLQTWRKIDISAKAPSPSKVNVNKTAEEKIDAKETFEPLDYADRAYNLISAILDEHNPTHVLIERQRFRSGGNSAVQEWTIRVGVFEGMLYAVLRSLAAERRRCTGLKVEPMQPTRVNRYWLEGSLSDNKETDKPAARRKGREIKQDKIELVRKLLLDFRSKSKNRLFEANDNISGLIPAFLPEAFGNGVAGSGRGRKASPTKRIASDSSKLDDLSDCLLQGLAWFRWQNNRLKLRSSVTEVLLD